MTCSNKPKGIISIVALIIFSLLMLFALIINLIVYDTYQIIKNTNNFFTARDVTSSVSEYLKAEIEGYNVGFNLGPIICLYENGEADESNEEIREELKGDELAGVKLVSQRSSDESYHISVRRLANQGLSPYLNWVVMV